MSAFLASKVLVTEDPPASRPLLDAPAAVTGMVGVAERGPVSVPTLCTSFEEYQQLFGGYVHGSALPLSVQAFFANGGRQLYVVRTAHYADITDPTSLTAKPASGAIAHDKDGTNEVRAKTPGTFGNALRVDIRMGEDGLDLDVSAHGRRIESWRGLSLDLNAPRFWVGTISSQSRHVQLEHKGATTTVEPQSVMLGDGDDGLTGLGPQDFIGEASSKTGIRALDRVLDLSLLVVPDAGVEVQRAMIAYCEQARRGYVFAVLDAPESLGAKEVADHVEREKLLELSEHAAMYWPWLHATNPAPMVFSERYVAVPPSGFVAGVLSQASGRPGGVYTPPAGLLAGRLSWVAGFVHDDCLDEGKRDIVYPARVNPLSTGPGMPYFIDGSRTLKAGGSCPWVSQRRGLSFIERCLESRLQYLRHRPLTSALLSEAYREATSFLMGQLRDGAFASQNPREAFRVEVPRSRQAATLEVVVGVALAQPAEFIWLHMSVALSGDGAVQGAN